MVHQNTDHCIWNCLESVRGAPYELTILCEYKSYNYIFLHCCYQLYILQPCPINFDPVTIPPVDNYTVTVINNSAMNMISVLSENITIDTCDYTTPVSEDNIPGVYTVEMSVNNIIGSTKTTSDPFSEFIIIANIML